MAAAFGVALHGLGQFLHRGGGLLEGAGLVLGAPRKILVACCNLAAGAGDRLGTLAHLGDGFAQRLIHVLQGLQQLAAFVAALGIDLPAQIAGGDAARQLHGLGQGPGDGARNRHRQQQGQHSSGQTQG